ncbi:39S ribosomal protein L44, mitochondrial [Hylaeus anthracinus]|uniref:39S ribosomal protein L44, mitochondrial n=1 Tax=Hylaeus anthracinus TaxID=313031 RepID=UPI0023B8F394|nr:39S ribosomal protein L44, mitochondrial [Hylaeus anthracinus]
MNKLRLCCNNLVRIIPGYYNDCRYIHRWVSATYKDLTRRKRRLPPQPEPIRSNFIEWNRDSEIYAFNQRLSEKFETEKLNKAFIHKSYIFEEEKKQKEIGIEEPKLDIEHNEDLIEKGRNITSEVAFKYLSKSLPHAPESAIIAFHDYLMSNEILATASLHIGTKDLILTAEHPVAEETLAKTFLALVAALAESADIDRASTFVRDFLLVGLANKDLTEIWCPKEPFKMLNDIVSNEIKAPVEPRIIRHAGTNTVLAVYQIAVYANKQFLGSGSGQTINEAKDVAAMNALCKRFGLLDSSQPLRFNEKIDLSI